MSLGIQLIDGIPATERWNKFDLVSWNVPANLKSLLQGKRRRETDHGVVKMRMMQFPLEAELVLHASDQDQGKISLDLPWKTGKDRVGNFVLGNAAGKRVISRRAGIPVLCASLISGEQVKATYQGMRVRIRIRNGLRLTAQCVFPFHGLSVSEGFIESRRKQFPDWADVQGDRLSNVLHGDAKTQADRVGSERQLALGGDGDYLHPRSFGQFSLLLHRGNLILRRSRGFGYGWGLFLYLPQSGQRETSQRSRYGNSGDFKTKRPPLPFRLRWPIFLLGTIMFSYFSWQECFNSRAPYRLCVLGTCAGTLILSYGVYLIAEFGKYLYQ